MMADNTKAVTPVPERVATPNLPYRGSVDHGVPYTNVEATDEAHYHMGRPVVYAEDDPREDVEPIPVRVVNQGARETKKFSTRNYFLTLGDSPVQVVGRNERRTKVTVQNNGDSAGGANSYVFVGTDTVSGINGYKLNPNLSLALNVTEPVYVAFPLSGLGAGFPVPAGGTVVCVSVLVEESERLG